MFHFFLQVIYNIFFSNHVERFSSKNLKCSKKLHPNMKKQSFVNKKNLPYEYHKRMKYIMIVLGQELLISKISRERWLI